MHRNIPKSFENIQKIPCHRFGGTAPCPSPSGYITGRRLGARAIDESFVAEVSGWSMWCRIAVLVEERSVSELGPGAQVAGKLAIALVDASRVFKMLVAIVLVGEHLTTPLTLIPSAACITHIHTTTHNHHPFTTSVQMHLLKIKLYCKVLRWVYVWLLVCLSVRSHNSKTARLNFANFYASIYLKSIRTVTDSTSFAAA